MKSYILTLVASASGTVLDANILERVAAVLGQAIGPLKWLKEGVAADMSCPREPDSMAILRLREVLRHDRIDFFLQPEGTPRKKKLLLSDMDCTMVVGETLDDLADQCGMKDKVAAITERAMRGEVDFRGALRERIGLLAGLPESAMEVAKSQIQITAGADVLVKTMRKNGATCILVSGGFSQFVEYVAQSLGFHGSHSNHLVFQDGILLGEVKDPIIDNMSKRQLLVSYTEKLGLEAGESLALGDGANDYEMLRTAGLGVGFRPKPFLQERINSCILYGDLSALLYAQGYVDF